MFIVHFWWPRYIFLYVLIKIKYSNLGGIWANKRRSVSSFNLEVIVICYVMCDYINILGIKAYIESLYFWSLEHYSTALGFLDISMYCMPAWKIWPTNHAYQYAIRNCFLSYCIFSHSSLEWYHFSSMLLIVKRLYQG